MGRWFTLTRADGMTERELAAIEKTWTVPNDGWNTLDVSTAPESMEAHAANVLALVAEVRRLRALVEGVKPTWKHIEPREAIEGTVEYL